MTIIHSLRLSTPRTQAITAAKLAGLEHLKPGDIIGVHFGDKSAHCNAIWVEAAGEMQKVDMGVKLVEGLPHPWQEEVQQHLASGTPPICRIALPLKTGEKSSRQRIAFEIEVRGGM